MSWVRAVAEVRWHEACITDLPWWAPASHVDEIAQPDRQPKATTYDGYPLAEQRARLEIDEFILRFERVSGYHLSELSSRLRSSRLIRGRVEFTTLAVLRYGFKGCELAALLGKHGNSVTRWLKVGLDWETRKPDFKNRLNLLDAEISSRR